MFEILFFFFFVSNKMNFLWYLQENEHCPKTVAIQPRAVLVKKKEEKVQNEIVMCMMNIGH